MNTQQITFRNNVELPLHPYLGFSSVTGEITDNHDLISVTTNEVVPRGTKGHMTHQSSPKYTKSYSGGFIKSIMKLFMYSIILTIFAVFAKVLNANYKSRQAKRF